MTKNERKVLSMLVDNARIHDSTIAEKLKITPQAVRKIRFKLESNHIHKYRTIVDYSKIGITTFAIAQMKINNIQVLSDKHIIGAFEINESNITHILILGFASLEDLDDYKKKISKVVDIHKINIISKKGFLKNSPVELIKNQLKLFN